MNKPKKKKATSPGNCAGNNMLDFRFGMNSNEYNTCVYVSEVVGQERRRKHVITQE